MKRFTALFCAFVVIALSALPINSFASQPLVFNHHGSIEALNFYFGEPGDSGLPVNLSSIGIEPFNALSVHIQTSGSELAIIDPDTADYFYYGVYGSGTIIAQGTNGQTVDIPMVSASLVESFIIEEPIRKAIKHPFTVETPFDTSLVFRAVLGSGNNTVRFALIVQHGEIVFAGTY
jgi:hypothetical protein